MRCMLIVLLLSTLILCADYDIHKLAKVFTGMTRSQSDKLDQITGKATDANGKLDQAKYQRLLKESGLEAKANKLRETLQAVAKEDKIAVIYIAAALDYAHRARRGNMTDDEASEKTTDEWNRLSLASQRYLSRKFPKIADVAD